MGYSETIKALRNKLLVTQTELARMLKVSYATVNRWENGHFEPTVAKKRAIRDLCKKSGVAFLEG